MSLSLLSLGDVSVVAHRGGAALRPENTMGAFDHGVALGADAIECDVHLSRDDVPVVIHDATLDRTTDATGPVEARTAAELATVDAGYRFGAEAGFPFRGVSGGVPALADLIDRCRSAPIVIEIKGDRPVLAQRTIEVVRDLRAQDRVMLAGFSADVMRAARQLAPEIPTSASRPEGQSALVRSYAWLSPARSGAAAFQVPFRIKGREMFGRQFVRAVRRGGTPVHVWVVNDPTEMRRLMSWGVTGLITDRPDIALDVVRSQRRPR